MMKGRHLEQAWGQVLIMKRARRPLALSHTLRMSIDQPADTPTLFKSAKAFATWLRRHHATPAGLWLKIAKRGAMDASVTYPEAVEIALCWGWIDGQKKGLDDQRDQSPCGLVAHSNGRESRDARAANSPTRGDARPW
jgi:hypothetical protein